MSPPDNDMRARSPQRTMLVTAAVVVVLAACSEGDALDSAAEARPEVVVTTLTSQPITLTSELPARTRPFLIADVRPQVRGIIKQRLFVEGSMVKAGQPLYEIDDAMYRAEYQSARAQLLKARAALQAAKLAADRARSLVRLGAVSVQQSEETIAAEAQAQAEVEVMQAAVASAQVNLAYAHIAAPIDGRIGRSSVTRGALVTAEQEMPLATIQQLDPMYVEMNESSSNRLAFMQGVDTGQLQPPEASATVTIRLDSGVEFAGKFDFADTTVDPATGNLLLRAIVPNPKHILLPGMYVRALVTEGVVTQGVLVSQQAVARQPNGRGRALVVNAEGKVEARDVDLARSIDNQWLVREGLRAGERVIVEGLHKAAPGSFVKPIEQGAAQATRQ